LKRKSLAKKRCRNRAAMFVKDGDYLWISFGPTFMQVAIQITGKKDGS
jgi:DeoR/GlpR family transcriptional regulator of sugar metabolism